MQKQTPPCTIICAQPGKLTIISANDGDCTTLAKNVPLELVDCDPMVKNGASHGWVAHLMDDGIWRLQDDLNPHASYTHPKRIPLPRCQTQIVTNVAVSSSSPEDQDCVVAVKLLGPQLSFCRPGQSKPEWTNIRIQNTCFSSSRVMFSKKDNMFRIPGAGVPPHRIVGSQSRSSQSQLSEAAVSRRSQADQDQTRASVFLVESQSTGETFMVRWYRKTETNRKCIQKMKTKAMAVFTLDGEGNAVYTQDIGDLRIIISNSEPFCVPASSFPGMDPNVVDFLDVDEIGSFRLIGSSLNTVSGTFDCPYQIPPQKID